MSPVGGSRWFPRSMSILHQWDASNAGSITSSLGRVSQWNDLIGTAHLTQGTGGQQPLTGSRTINGLNALYFQGTTRFDNMKVTTVINAPYAVMTVWLADSFPGANNRHYDGYNGGNPSRDFWCNGTGIGVAGKWWSHSDTGRAIATGSARQHLLSFGVLGGTRFFENGVQFGGNLGGSGGTARVDIATDGSSTSTNTSWDGLVAEVQIWAGEPDSAFVAAWTSYATAKWGT